MTQVLAMNEKVENTINRVGKVKDDSHAKVDKWLFDALAHAKITLTEAVRTEVGRVVAEVSRTLEAAMTDADATGNGM